MSMKSFRVLLLLVSLLTAAGPLRAEKVGTLTDVFGAHSYHIEGVGIVTGLKGTGDKGTAAIKLVKEYLEKNNISLDEADLSSKNIAFVKIDAEVPPFMRVGQKIDVRVSLLNDATSLEGGVLQQAALRARPDGEIYAFASGRVLVGSSQLHPTTGIVPANTKGGGQLQKVIRTRVVEDDYKFRLNLKQQSFADAAAVAQVINESTLNPYRSEGYGFAEPTGRERKIAWALDAGQVIVQIPKSKHNQQVEFIMEVLKLPVPVDRPARVLFNRQSRTVIVTGDVGIGPTAIAQGDRYVTLAEPQPNQLAQGYRHDNADERRLVELEGPQQSLPNLKNMIDTLNAMGTSAEDMVAILQKMKTSGALRAELIVE